MVANLAGRLCKGDCALGSVGPAVEGDEVGRLLLVAAPINRDEGNLDSLSTTARSRRKGGRLAKLPTHLSAQIILDVGNHNRGRAWFDGPGGGCFT